jgi:hypothetical protein
MYAFLLICKCLYKGAGVFVKGLNSHCGRNVIVDHTDYDVRIF